MHGPSNPLRRIVLREIIDHQYFERIVRLLTQGLQARTNPFRLVSCGDNDDRGGILRGLREWGWSLRINRTRMVSDGTQEYSPPRHY
jgi:hypothetical protein